tara:strand:+ start:18702 stop:20336 length:1635 start_codon:yes stop_codon:yes gene_type:complete
MKVETNKQLLFGHSSRAELLKGVDILANAVKITMGPRGQNVVIERPGMPPHLTKDGVTVAQAVNLRSKFSNLGVQMIKEAANRTAEVAGDGTTTATVISHSIFSEGLKMLAAGYSPTEICKGVRIATEHVIKNLQEIAEPVTSDEEIIQVGTISSNGDETIGRLLCAAMKEVGRDGVIAVEDAKGFKTSLDVVEGTEINRGYISPYFITDQDKMSVIMNNPYVFLTNQKIISLNDILPLLEKIHDSQRPLLIIADDIEGDALQGLVLNKVKGTLNVCAIRGPEFGESRLHAMDDLGIMLNAEVLQPADDIKDFKLEDLGQCKKLVVGKNHTTFIDCAGSKENIEERASQLRELSSDPTLLGPDLDVISRRLTRLAGGVAILKVGGATEVELLEKKDRVEDALHATQAAVEEGILPGGGIALVRAARSLDTLKQSKTVDGVQVGIEIVKKACSSPLLQIANNSGASSQIVLEKVLRFRDDNKGYNAYKDEYVDMLDAGIIDPLKVVRSALEHASSAACNLLSVGCAMIEDDSSEHEDIDSLLVTQ